MSNPIVFWRDGYSSGKSGAFVRGMSLNEAVSKWEAEGIHVAGIVVDPKHGSNVNLIIADTRPARGGEEG